MRVHWFLPENDLALAAGTANYTPPTAARRLRDAGAALPLWYGAPGDRVVCYGINNAWYECMAADFGLETDVFDHEPHADMEAAPWGWSAYSRRLYEGEGFAPDQLPADEQLATMRRLSHRATGARIACILAERLPDIHFTAPAVEVTDASALPDDMSRVVVKAPYSSSGRGVWMSADTPADRLAKIAADTIRAQGSVMVEPQHEKVIDFARIYECRDGRCADVGTSVFTTDAHGAYSGNLLASEAERLATVAAHYPETDLKLVFDTLRRVIEEEIAPYYNGVVGVDMLITADGVLDPMVELNLRTTMGYVACRLSETLLAPGARGVFAVTSLRQAPEPDSYEARDGRLVSGLLNLVPANPHFAFTVKI